MLHQLNGCEPAEAVPNKISLLQQMFPSMYRNNVACVVLNTN